jgi:uncharacterized protein YciI
MMISIPSRTKLSLKSFQRGIQYLVIAKDYQNALEKRLAVREQHLQRAKGAKKDGFILFGGATLSESNIMDGSMMVFEANSQDEVEAFLSQDPYVKGKVWESWTIKQFKLAPMG